MVLRTLYFTVCSSELDITSASAGEIIMYATLQSSPQVRLHSSRDLLLALSRKSSSLFSRCSSATSLCCGAEHCQSAEERLRVMQRYLHWATELVLNTLHWRPQDLM